MVVQVRGGTFPLLPGPTNTDYTGSGVKTHAAFPDTLPWTAWQYRPPLTGLRVTETLPAVAEFRWKLFSKS